MTEPILIPPIAGETIAMVSSYPELVEAFRIMKARLGLSNKWCDGVCDFADGVTDKKLGPSHTKPINPLDFSMFCHVFAVKFRMEIDLDAVRKMEGHWEGREEGKVAVPESRMSRKLLDKAKPIVAREYGKLGGMVTAHLRTPAQRSEAARHAALSKHQKLRKNRVRCPV